MPKTFRLSEEQARAVKAFSRDTGVSAAAGSGKTTVLVERYLEAVTKKGVFPENILAVTFTDKAANVMKERIRRRASERGLDDLLRRMDGAWIGTIHSFCVRFLKENPVESGVDPSFAVLGAGEQEMMMEKLLDRLFEEESSSETMLQLLADYDEEAVRGALKDFYDLLRSSTEREALLAVKSAEKPLKRSEEDLLSLCGSILSDTPKETGGPPEKLRAAASLVREALRARTRGWERVESVLFPAEELKLNSTRTKAAAAALKEGAQTWSAWTLQELSEPLKKEWVRLAGRFAELYENEKRAASAYDFEDLLYYAYRALTGKSPESQALRARASRQFAYVFVDEYQDTSALQAGILESLKQKNNLFVVGDARQSIYRFRHAHPEIFAAALERSQKLTLAENYRSRPEILNAVNGLFGDLFGASYEKLLPRRKFVLKKKACLERIEAPKDERGIDAARVIEARTIASRVREMIDGGYPVEEDGKCRAASYRDFAILLKRSTSSRLYEKELEAFSIPYFVNKGRGFYEKTEVMDLVNFLRILENPSENIAMASVLRSPLVQLSDDALYWLSRRRLSGAERPLGAVLSEAGAVPELADADREKIADFLGIFGRLRSQKDRLEISELLQEVLRETAYEAKMLTGPEGRQARANALKLVELAAEVEDKSVRGISDFIRYLKSVSDSPEREAEARRIGEEEDAVRILTIHAAKGLEFPCVILADMGARGGKSERPPFLASPTAGLGMRLKSPDGAETRDDAAYRAVLEETKSAEEAESIRLLYVAMTRAKEHLILAGVGGGEKNTLAQASKLMEAHKIPVREIPVVLKRPAPLKKERILADDLPGLSDEALAKRLEEELTPVEKPYETLEDLTVSRILASLPSETPEEAPEDRAEEVGEADEEATPRNEYGTVFHRLMELAVRHGSERLPAETWTRLTADLADEERVEMKESFDRFWKSPLGASVRAAERRYPELPFIFKTKHGLLKGQIDLIFKERGGGWAIVDYKTNRLAGEKDKEAAVQKYSWQLGLYALAFWKLHGEIPRRTVLYFTHSHESAELRWTEEGLGRLAEELEERYRDCVKI